MPGSLVLSKRKLCQSFYGTLLIAILHTKIKTYDWYLQLQEP